MPNELIPMSTWTPKDGQTYEIVDKDARERLDDAEDRIEALEEGGGGAVTSVNNVQPDSNGNVSLSANDVGAGTYSKPSGGIPASDLATGVIPSVPAMASELDMSDWDNGKTVDAAVLAADFTAALTSLNGVAARLEALADSDDTTLDQLSEIVAYIKNNKSLIDGVTTSKVSVTDIVNSLVSTETGKPLSAAQGRALKALIDAIVVPTAVSQLTNDEGFQTAAQVQTAVSGKLDANGNAYRSASIPMGELDSTSTATVMTATVPGITELRDGVCMWLRNGVITSASGFTININNLGAKPCYSSLAAASRSTTIFNVNYALLMIYNSTRVDGGCWDIVYGVDTNTTYTPPKLGFGYGTCTTAAATAAKTASISSYALTTGGIVAIKFDNDVPANATLNITSKGAKAIYHRGAAITAGVIKAGDVATFVYSTYYHLISIDRDETADLTNYQTKAITDTGGYFTTDTVDGALQEIGAELAGINTLIGTGVIT